MAELLTNDPNAMISLSGAVPERPCGIFWFSPCTFNNFNDWYATLKSRFNILKRNYNKLKEISKVPGQKELNVEEVALEQELSSIDDVIKEMKDVKSGLHRNTYYQKIATMQSALADTNALIEFVQQSLEDRNVRSYITTGIQRPGFPWGTALMIGLVAGGSIWAYKSWKGSRTTSLSSANLTPWASRP